MLPHRHHGIRADTDLGSIRNILLPATTRPAIYRLVNRLTCGVDAWHALRTSPDFEVSLYCFSSRKQTIFFSEDFGA